MAITASDMLDLPYAVVSDDANMEEYTQETALGIIPKRTVTRGPDGREHFEEHDLVTFFTDDPENPKNWSKPYKWHITIVLAATCFVVGFSSSVITADFNGVQEEYAIGEELALLTITVFVIGFGIGPLVFAPMSELAGRKPVYVLTFTLAFIFEIPCALADSLSMLLVCRLIDGVAFSAPVALVGGTLSDLWRIEDRGVPMAIISAATFAAPAIGPLVGGYLSQAEGWRWLYWIQLILAGTVWLLMIFTVPETHTPTILTKRATRLRRETGDPRYTTERELEPRPLHEELRIFMARPLALLSREPIALMLALYMSVLYGLLYMFFVAFPLVYQEGKGWSAGSTGLTFIPLALGVILSAFFAPLVNRHYQGLCANAPNGKPAPEARVLPMMFACWAIPIGLSIFAWTSFSDVSYWGPMMGGFPIGFGFVFLNNSINLYLVDTYQGVAASALAGNTFVSRTRGACVVLFTVQMYHRLGYEWAGSLMAFISLACCAIPFLFYYKGAAIRKFSHYAEADDDGAMGEAKEGQV